MFVPNAPTADRTGNPAPFVDVQSAPPLKSIFLFDTRNRQYLDRSVSQPYLRPAEVPILAQLLVLAFSIIFFMITYEGSTMFLRWALTNSAGVTTQASVVNRWVNSGRNPSYNITYAFIVNGKRYEVSQTMSPALYQRVGETVDISYWPNDPNFARLVGAFEVQDMARNSFLQVALSGLVAIGLVVFSVVNFGAWCKLLANQRLLRNEGRLLYGEIITSHSEKDGKHGYKITVRYGLLTPDGRYLTNKQARYPSSLRGRPQAIKGTPVAVMYVDDTHLEML
jgi:hypothetical protein